MPQGNEFRHARRYAGLRYPKAIEAFEVTLVTPNSPFDQFLEGNDGALTDAQKQGLELFIDKGCTACHSGVNLGGQEYFPFGQDAAGPAIRPGSSS